MPKGCSENGSKLENSGTWLSQFVASCLLLASIPAPKAPELDRRHRIHDSERHGGVRAPIALLVQQLAGRWSKFREYTRPMNIELADLELPARLVFTHPVSADEFWRVSQQNPDLRLERSAKGELLIMAPTGLEGGGVEGDVFGELRQWSIEDGRGKAYGATAGVTLPDSSVRAADACWISWTRLNALTAAERKRFAPVTPEFVIEVRSESDSLADLRQKMGEWLANGVELAWLVDPSRKTVEIYRPNRQPEIQEGHTAVYGEGPVGGFVLELARIWG